MRFYAYLAQNPRTHERVLRVLAEEALAQDCLALAQGLVRNPKTPREVLTLLAEAQGERGWYLKDLPYHPNLPEGVIRDLLPRVPEVLGNPNLPEGLFEAYRKEVRRYPWFLANPRMDPMEFPWWEGSANPFDPIQHAPYAVAKNPRIRKAQGKLWEVLIPVAKVVVCY